MPTISERFKRSWSAFFNNRDPSLQDFPLFGNATSYRPDRTRMLCGNEKSIINAIYTRIALDVSSVEIKHARLDENECFKEEISSYFNDCLQLDANLDQTGREFIKDVVISLCDEGVVAIVPTDTTENPYKTDSYDILEMRTAKIIQWYPSHVMVRVYNEKTGKKEDLTLPKKMVAIIENPFYSVMNEPNSTLKRLTRKFALLDYVDEQNGAGKLDMIIQLPYVIKSEARREQAEQRRKDIEVQLSSSKYGIAYTDGTEKITQLNRPIDNQLLAQIESLTKLLYSQLGITEEVLNGTADEKTMLNYYNRTIEPFLSAICDEMRRKFLTKTARSQHQSVVFLRDPFKLVPINNIAEIADKFTRNEILSSNEFRAIVGFRPRDTERANELSNKNMPVKDEAPTNFSDNLKQDPMSEDKKLISQLDEMVDTYGLKNKK